MDFNLNDKAWTRNIHQKFDSVCQEVDDFVSMDTLKYVENQVQNIGDSVIGFCSNVLQDFLPSALSNPVNLDAETVPREGKCVTKTYKKSIINLKEKYPGQDSVHHIPPFSALNNIKQPMPMPTEDNKKLTKSLIHLVKDEPSLVHDNVKSSVEGCFGSEVEGLAMENFLSEDLNSNGINDETSLVFVTENGHHTHEITDEAVSAAIVDGVRVCSSVKDRTCDSCFDDCHCKISGTPQSSKLEYSFVSSTSSLSNDSFYQSFFPIPHETKYFVYDHTDSISCVSDIPDEDSSRVDDAVSSNGSSGHKNKLHCDLSQSEDLWPVVEIGHADESNIDISNPNMETIDLSEKTKLDESCVIVDNKLLVATSFRPRKHRSFKQIIKDACTSTKRLTKEYEQLGISYGDTDMEFVQPEKHSLLPSSNGISSGTKHSPTNDLGDSESEWELL